MQSWQSNMPSHAGRLTLVSAVLSAIPPIYFMATAHAPQTTRNMTEQIIRRFYWGKQEGRYMAYVAWKKACWPENLRAIDEALLLIRLWKLATKKKI